MAVAVAACCWLLPGCGGGGGTGAGVAHPALVASILCEDLRIWENEMIDVVNAGARAVTDTDDPSVRAEAIDDTFADLLAGAVRRRNQVDARDQGGDAGLARLNLDLAEGMALGVEELEAERRLFRESVPQVDDADERGRVGQLFNALEKTFAVAEPAPAAYLPDALVEALRNESSCAHVMQLG